MRLKLFLLLLLTATLQVVKCQKIMEQPLYTGLIPNAIPAENLEKTEINQGGVWFTTGTSIPTLTVFPAKKPNGHAVVICPGGGYFGTAGNHEGTLVAKALNKAGVTAFVLKYRIPNTRTCVDPSLAPLQDVQEAIRQVRRNAARWKVQPDQIGIMGFSAGGHLAASAAVHYDVKADKTCTDTTSVRPDFAILIYPVISFTDSLTHKGSRSNLLGATPTKDQIAFFSNEFQVKAGGPPVFLVHAQDDTVVPVGNSIAFYTACTRAGVRAAMHLYPQGGHGFGMNNPTTKDRWMDLLITWMSDK